MLGANNRQLGRSDSSFAATALCRSACLELATRIGECERLMEAGARNAAWTWQLRLDGRVVARATRSYLRRNECEYNLGRFVEAMQNNVHIVATARSVYVGRK